MSRTPSSEPDEPKAETGRETTRFLHFKRPNSKVGPDTLERLSRSGAKSRGIAWLAIIEGPGEGNIFPIDKPFVNVGRCESQDIQINFGDDSISRQGHISIAYYGRETGFVIRDGLKPNPVLLNERALQGEHDLQHGDRICIGETTLQFGRH